MIGKISLACPPLLRVPAVRMLISGFGGVIVFGWMLLEERAPNIAWSWTVLLLGGSITGLSIFMASWGGKPATSGAQGTTTLWAVGMGALVAASNHIWAVVSIGALSALAFAHLFRSRNSSILLMFGGFLGWMIAVIIAMVLPWPNSQRFALVLLLVFLVNALQSGIEWGWESLTIRTPSKEDV